MGLLHTVKDPNEAYIIFLNVFSHLYEVAFPKIKIKVRFLKNRNSVNEKNYKTFTHLFDSIKQKFKKTYYHNLLITYDNDMKRI